ncbi:MAG: IS66 family transposase zinc-finger binding domain-containing protein [Sphingobacteriales bacterium]|nr:IS66 family transposase zinc-finger binding domain-containing protein [Sphingobacteriales bacterium]
MGLPSVCSCGCNLSGVSVVKEVKRQVFDIPDPKLRVTEYVQRQAKCPGCGKGVRVEFPRGLLIMFSMATACWHFVLF